MKLLIILLVLCPILGCRSADRLKPEILPVYAIEYEPRFEGEISLESDDAGVRYVYLADQIIDGKIYIDCYLYVDESGIDQFVAYSTLTDEIDSDQCIEYLIDHQEQIDQIIEASYLEKYCSFVPPALYALTGGEKFSYEVFKATRTIREVLEADAVRLWAQGNTSESIRRIDSEIRIGLQIQRLPNADTLSGFHSRETLHSALTIFERMLQSDRCVDREREQIQRSLRQIEGNDPSGLLWLFVRHKKSVEPLMSEWFQVDGGSHELWMTVVNYMSAMQFIDSIMFVFDETLEATFETKNKDALFSFDEIDWNQESVELIQRYLDIDFEDLQRALNNAQSDYNLMLRELESGSPDIDIIKSISERAEQDDTPISGLLDLTTVHAMVNSHYELIELRNRLIEMSESD